MEDHVRGHAGLHEAVFIGHGHFHGENQIRPFVPGDALPRGVLRGVFDFLDAPRPHPARRAVDGDVRALSEAEPSQFFRGDVHFHPAVGEVRHGGDGRARIHVFARFVILREDHARKGHGHGEVFDRLGGHGHDRFVLSGGVPRRGEVFLPRAVFEERLIVPGRAETGRRRVARFHRRVVVLAGHGVFREKRRHARVVPVGPDAFRAGRRRLVARPGDLFGAAAVFQLPEVCQRRFVRRAVPEMRRLEVGPGELRRGVSLCDGVSFFHVERGDVAAHFGRDVRFRHFHSAREDARFRLLAAVFVHRARRERREAERRRAEEQFPFHESSRLSMPRRKTSTACERYAASPGMSSRSAVMRARTCCAR